MTSVSAIVTTTGTRSAWLQRGVTSVLEQTFEVTETVVVVDGGPDADRAVRRMLDGRVRVVRNERRRGVGGARNTGARHARGTFLCYLDDDDLWKPEYLDRVFANGADFDLALTAFEKHLASGDVVPDKIPPEILRREAFAARNGGLRGSNLVVRRELFERLGGFDESLRAFGDMDFAVRAARLPDVRYRRVVERLVEYHSHGEPRITSRDSPLISQASARYLMKHGPEFRCDEEAVFRERARRFWARDPWRPPLFERRHRASKRAGVRDCHMPGLLQGAESALLEAIWDGRPDVGACEASVTTLCREFEASPTRPKIPNLRLGITTTNNRGALARFVRSLQDELDRSQWGIRQLGVDQVVSLLVVENDSDREIREENRRFLENLRDARLHVTHRRRPADHVPWPIGASRSYLLAEELRLGGSPSVAAPVWLLDEDLQWSALLPSEETTWTMRPVGSTLHRVEMLLRSASADAMFGGTTGSPPVPALSAIALQVGDLLSGATDASPHELARAHPDYYYDLSAHPGAERRLGLICAWWRGGRETRAGELADRLLGGAPVTRPAVHVPHVPTGSAWLTNRNQTVVGGNLLLLSDKVARPDWFVQLRSGDLVSRRADTCWGIQAKSAGATVGHYAFPLLHARQPRPELRPAALADELQRDALGVGLYRALVAGADIGSLARAAAPLAELRCAAVLENLEKVAEILRGSFLDPMRPTLVRVCEILRGGRGAFSDTRELRVD